MIYLPGKGVWDEMRHLSSVCWDRACDLNRELAEEKLRLEKYYAQRFFDLRRQELEYRQTIIQNWERRWEMPDAAPAS